MELTTSPRCQTAVMWLTAQLYDLSEYCGCKDKLTGRQLEQCAELTAALYHWLKTSELMLFFARFKAGTYGRFYGSIDPMVIMSSLRIFIGEDRSNAIDRHESKLREQERDRWQREHQARLSSTEQQESVPERGFRAQRCRHQHRKAHQDQPRKNRGGQMKARNFLERSAGCILAACFALTCATVIIVGLIVAYKMGWWILQLLK